MLLSWTPTQDHINKVYQRMLPWSHVQATPRAVQLDIWTVRKYNSSEIFGHSMNIEISWLTGHANWRQFLLWLQTQELQRWIKSRVLQFRMKAIKIARTNLENDPRHMKWYCTGNCKLLSKLNSRRRSCPYLTTCQIWWKLNHCIP